MKTFVLPESAFSHSKPHTILGRRFIDGRLTVDDADAEKMRSQFVNFYGATVEDVVTVTVDEDDQGNPNPPDATLAKESTQAPKD